MKSHALFLNAVLLIISLCAGPAYATSPENKKIQVTAPVKSTDCGSYTDLIGKRPNEIDYKTRFPNPAAVHTLKGRAQAARSTKEEGQVNLNLDNTGAIMSVTCNEKR